MSKILENYLRDISLNQYSAKTINARRYFLEKINRIKPLEKWTNEDIKDYLFEIQKTYKPSTVEHHKAQLLAFFNSIKKHDVVEGLEIKAVDNHLKREDILTYDDNMSMVNATNSPFYKALMMLLFDGGGRIMEVLECRGKDVIEKDGYMIVNLHQTKRGKQLREVVCIYAQPYIRNHINYAGIAPEDYLFPSPINPDKHIHPSQVLRAFKKIAIKAGIKKKVNPHMWRHSWATNMCLQEYPEAMIKQGAGWTKSSRAIDRYVHLVKDDFTQARLRKEGKVLTPSPEIPKHEIQIVEPIQPIDEKAQLKQLKIENMQMKKTLDEVLEFLKNQSDRK